MTELDALRKQLIETLKGRGAHADFDSAVAGFPARRAGEKPGGAPHTAWQLLEHMRIAQWDILEFSRNSKHVSPEWPAGYWPPSAGPASESEWTASVQAFRRDRAEFQRLLRDESRDLDRPFPWGDGQTLLREALLIVDHNSYHLGQLLLVRKSLGLWPGQ